MKPVTALLIMLSERRGTVLEQIEACGVHVFPTGGVEGARAILRSRSVDLIFTDGTLPDGSWRDVVAHRILEGLPCEVILCADRLDSKLCAEAFARGVWDVVVESGSREELRRTIDSAVSHMYMHSLGARGPAIARAAS
jgi:DNA-binding NtrC family response regulator